MSWDDLYKFPLWLAERPQQALYQGAQAGADEFGRNLNLGDNPVVNMAKAGIAGVRSIPAFAAGAWEGLTGQNENLEGRDMVDGLDINRHAKATLGTALDLTADPSSVVTAIGSKVPTAMRTYRNLKAMEGTPYGQALDRLGARKYLADIPVVPKHGEPLYVRGHGDITRYSDEFYMGRGNSGDIAGEYVQMPHLAEKGAPGIIFTETNSSKKIVPHEKFHHEYAYGGGPEVREEMRQLSEYGDEWGKLRDEVQRLYHENFGDNLMNEVLAFATHRGMDSPLPLTKALQDKARSNIPEEVLKGDYSPYYVPVMDYMQRGYRGPSGSE